MKAPQRILVPSDFSPYADKALEEALFLAKQFKATIYIVHVVEDLQPCSVDYCLPEELITQYRDTSFKASQEMLQKEIDKYQEAHNVQIIKNVRIGAAAEEILKEAEAMNIDLIVIASHGKTGIIQHLMGSVAERVTRRAKCQVMVVKA
jgi:universal stress protein A